MLQCFNPNRKYDKKEPKTVVSERIKILGIIKNVNWNYL